jgi:hypothetical protein
VRRISLKNCPHCGRPDELYSSRPHTWGDELCLFFFLQVVRCHSCMHRHYRPLFLQAVPAWTEAEPLETVANEEKQQRQA